MADSEWKNRIVGFEVVSPQRLQANPLNWRTHPKFQREALVSVLERVGWVGAVMVNVRTGRIVDGHLRVEEALKSGEQVPVLYVDLSEEEERLVLATFDPISALADVDEGAVDRLLADVQVSDEVLGGLASQALAEAGYILGGTAWERVRGPMRKQSNDNNVGKEGSGNEAAEQTEWQGGDGNNANGLVCIYVPVKVYQALVKQGLLEALASAEWWREMKIVDNVA